MTRELVTVPAGRGLEPIVPNRQAARTLAVPYRPLEQFALRTLQEHGLFPAPALTARRQLERSATIAGGSDDGSGLARAAEPTLRELLRAGVDLERLAASPEPRISRLGRIAIHYLRSLEAQGLVDPAQLLWRASRLQPRRIALCVSGYPRLPAAERVFIDALAGEGSEVHLPLADDPLFQENREALTAFEELGWTVTERADGGAAASTAGAVNGQPGTVPKQPGEHGLVGAAAAARWLHGDDRSLAVQPPAGIEAFAYADLEAEARGTLAAVKELLLVGVSPSEIAIVARDETAYGPVLLTVAEEYALPLRAMYQIPLSETRVGAWLSQLLDVIGADLPFEETARLLRSPLVEGLDARQWQEVRKERTSGREAWEPYQPALAAAWPEQALLREFVHYLRDLLDALGVRDRAVQWAREAAAFQELSDELASLPDPDRELTFEGFAAQLSQLQAVLTVPAHPGRGGVELHSPLSMYGAKVSHLFVVGTTEGAMPTPVRVDPLLDPFERQQLHAQGIAIETVTAAARREELSFWTLLHCAGRRLEFSYPKLLGRKETLPSPFLSRLGLEARPAPERPLCSLQELRPLQLAQSPAGGASTTHSDVDSAAAANAADPVLENIRHTYAVESRRESELPFDEYDGLVGIPFVPPRPVGVTSLINQAGCPFKFYSGHLLGLREPEEGAEELEASLRGNLYHLVLQLVMDRARGGVGEEARSLALEALPQAFEEAEEELRLPSLPGWPLQREEQLRALRRAISAAEFIEEGASVLGLEAQFESEWRGLPVRGKVDRLDALPDGLTLIDYKAGKRVYSKGKDENGRSKVDMQLNIYGTAAETLAPGLPMSSARYFSVTSAAPISVKPPSEDDLDRIAAELREQWRSGSFPVQPDIDWKTCEYCPFDSLCRRGPRLVRKREAE